MWNKVIPILLLGLTVHTPAYNLGFTFGSTGGETIHDICHGIVKFNGTTTNMSAMNNGMSNVARCALGWNAGFNSTNNTSSCPELVACSNNTLPGH